MEKLYKVISDCSLTQRCSTLYDVVRKLVQLVSLSLWEPHSEHNFPLSIPPEGNCLMALSTIPLWVLWVHISLTFLIGLLAPMPEPTPMLP